MILNSLRYRFFSWLSAQLLEYQQPAKAAHAMISPTAFLSREADIENIRRDIQYIKVGAHSHVRGRLLTYGHGGRIEIGEWCYVGVRTEIWSMESIVIGDRVLIAHDVNIHDGTAHSTNSLERHEHYRRITTQGHPRRIEELPGISSAPIVIEDDVWISFGVTILKGVRIGAGSVIAAGSVVLDDVPPRTFYRCEVKPLLSPLDS